MSVVPRAGGYAWDALIEDPRNGRDMESRANQNREELVYREPSNLPEPTERPGLVHRWVRTKAGNETDARNFTKRSMDGWRPVRLKDYPEMMVLMASQTDHPDKNGPVSVGELTLCVIHESKANAIRRHYQSKTNNILNTVDQKFMEGREYDHLGVRRENNSFSQRTFGSGVYRE